MLGLRHELAKLTGSLTLYEVFFVLRRRLGLSQHQLAMVTDVPAVAISMIEKGSNGDEAQIDALCRFFEEEAERGLEVGELSVAEMLAVLRRRNELSQADLAEITGIPGGVLSMAERETRIMPRRHLEALVAYYRARAKRRERADAASVGASRG